MNKIVTYVQETVNELLYKVSWPSWEDLQRSAVTVLIASIIIALIIWIMDQSSSLVLGTYYDLFKPVTPDVIDPTGGVGGN